MRAVRYVLRRAGIAVLMGFFCMVVLFWLGRLTPGTVLDQQTNSEHFNLVSNDQDRAALGFDKPIYTQFFLYLGKLVKGRSVFSRSYFDPERSFFEHLNFGGALQYTRIQGAMIFVFGFLYLVAVACLSVIYHDKFLDRSLVWGCMFLDSLPVFLVAKYLRHIFLTEYELSDGISVLESGNRGFAQLYVPIVFATLFLWILRDGRQLRDYLLDAMRSDYVRTGKAKGLTSDHLLLHHALLPAVLPLIGQLGGRLGCILTGYTFTEQLFSLPGVTTRMYQAAKLRDHDLLIPMTMMCFLAAQLGNFFSETAQICLDPQLRRKQFSW